MKKTLLLLLAIVMATTTFAQVQSKSITPTGNEIWWGYFIEDDVNASNFTGYGVSERANYETAIRISANNPNLGNATVKAFRIWLNATTIPKITRLRVWFIKNIKVNAADNALYAQDVDVSTLTAGANDIALNTPFEIKNATTFAGYTIELSAQDNGSELQLNKPTGNQSPEASWRYNYLLTGLSSRLMPLRYLTLVLTLS